MGGWSTNQMRNFCFQEGFRGGFHSLSDVELALACCSKMWGCNMPRQRTISLRGLNARWKWLREPRTHGNRIPLQIFSRKCHFWDLTVFFLCVGYVRISFMKMTLLTLQTTSWMMNLIDFSSKKVLVDLTLLCWRVKNSRGDKTGGDRSSLSNP